MRNRWVWWIVGCGIFAAAAALVALRRPWEAQFAGRPVSFWAYRAAISKELTAETSEAISKLGSRIVPDLGRLFLGKKVLPAWMLSGPVQQFLGAELDSTSTPQSVSTLQENSAARLRELGTRSRDLVPILRQILRIQPTTKAQRDLQKRSLTILASLGPEAREALPEILYQYHLARGSRDSTIWPASQALRMLGPLARSAEPTLREELQSNVWLNRLQAMELLLATTGNTNEAALFFSNALREIAGRDYRDSELALVFILENLARLGPVSEPTIPMLIDLLTSRDSDRKAMAAHTLARIGNPWIEAARPKLINALHETYSSTRRKGLGEIVLAVCRTGSGAETMIPSLSLMLDDASLDLDHLELREQIAIGLAAIGKPSERIIPQFVRLLTSDNSGLRLGAAAALQTLEPSQHSAATEILKSMVNEKRGGNSQLWKPTIVLLQSIGPEAKWIVPSLHQLMSSLNPAVREEAREALWRIEGLQRIPSSTLLGLSP